MNSVFDILNRSVLLNGYIDEYSLKIQSGARGFPRSGALCFPPYNLLFFLCFFDKIKNFIWRHLASFHGLHDGYVVCHCRYDDYHDGYDNCHCRNEDYHDVYDNCHCRNDDYHDGNDNYHSRNDDCHDGYDNCHSLNDGCHCRYAMQDDSAIILINSVLALWSKNASNIHHSFHSKISFLSDPKTKPLFSKKIVEKIMGIQCL